MRRVWGPVAVILVSLCPAAAQSSASYASCKRAYELKVPAGMSGSETSDGGFDVSAPGIGKLRVTAVADRARASLWYRNGELIRKYRVENDHGRARFVGDWERVDGFVLLEWVGDRERPRGHMAHAQPVRPAEVRYGVLRKTGGEWMVYEFTLTGAAAAMPFSPKGMLRKVLDGFRTLPADDGACSERMLANGQTTPALRR